MSSKVTIQIWMVVDKLAEDRIYFANHIEAIEYFEELPTSELWICEIQVDAQLLVFLLNRKNFEFSAMDKISEK